MKKCMNSLKRVLSMVMVIAMIMTMMPVTASAADSGTWMYLKPNSNWTQDSAWFAMYYWVENGASHWGKMTDVDGDGVYTAMLPSGYSKVIFCRMNPAKTALDWNSKWDQTVDLTVQAGKNLFTVANGAWNNASGTWSVYAEPAYYVAGDAALCGSEWNNADPANKMTMIADGLYEKTFSNVPAGSYELKVTNGTCDKTWGNNGDNYVLKLDVKSNVTVRLDLSKQKMEVAVVEVPSVYNVTFNGTNVTSNGVDKATEGQTYTATLTAKTGYTLPESVTVTGGTASYNKETGELTITNITGNVTITAEGVKIPAVYDVEFKGTGVGSDGEKNATEGEPYIARLTAAQGYTLPESVTVTVGGNAITGYTYTKTTGELTIPGELVTGDIVITAVGVAEPTGVTVYFINSNGWGEVKAYAWNSTGNNAWPGVAMTKTGEKVNGFDVYGITFATEYENIIFNNNSGTQTADLTLQAGQYYDYKAGKWYGSLEDVPQVDPTVTDTVLVGDFNSWNANANPFKLNAAGEKVGYVSLELAANTTYGFKLIKSGTWLGNNGTITGSISGWEFDAGSGKCTIKTAEAGTYVFAFNLDHNQISVTYPQPAAPKTYTVELKGENVTSSNTATSIEEKTEYTTTLTADTGYTLPEKVSVKIGNAEAVEYTLSNGVLTIPAASVTGDIVITVEVVKNPASYTVTFNGTNVTSNGAETVTEGKDYTATLTAGEGYKLPETVTVTGGEVDYNKETGELTITNITGNVTITAVGEKISAEPETITVYFRNDWKWGEVNLHYWNDADSSGDSKWPGITMTFVETVGGNDMYSAKIPANVTGVIFSGLKDDNSNIRQKTRDVAAADISDGAAFTIEWDGDNNDGSANEQVDNYKLISYTPEGGEETANDYYLVGYINGADNDGNDYKFTDNKLTVTFTSDSYVLLKDNTNQHYIPDAAVSDATSATLNKGDWDPDKKVKVPAGTYEFTVVENADGSLTLSFAEAAGGETATEYYLVGYINGADNDGNDYKFNENGKVKVTFTSDSYVLLKDNTNQHYIPDAAVLDATSATLNKGDWDPDKKVKVPAGTYEFTVVENADGSLTLSFVEAEEDEKTTYTAIFHFANTIGWNPVNLYVWNTAGATTGGWPGSAMSTRDENGYYTMTVSYDAATNPGLNYIFNTSSAQTVDLKVEADKFDAATNTAEIWVSLKPGAEGEKAGIDKDSYTGPLGGVKLAVSPQVVDDDVTFEFIADDATSVEVRGTVPGATWDSGVAMTKNEKGIWTVTLKDLPYGIYEYKFVVDGKDWFADPDGSTNAAGNSTFTIMDPNAVDNNVIKVIVTYTRDDGNYENWNIAAWDAPGLEEQYNFTKDENGVYSTVITLDGRATQTLGFKVRKSIGSNKWAEQSGEIRVDLSKILAGTVYVYVTGSGNNHASTQSTGADLVMGNKIKDIQLDYQNNTITVTTTMSVQNAETAFLLCKDKVDAGIVESITVSGNSYTMTLKETLNLKELYKYTIRFTEDKLFPEKDYEIGIDSVYATKKFADEFTYEGKDLGAIISGDTTTFKVWAPTAEAVSVKLYKSGTKGTEDCIGTYPMTGGTIADKGVWTLNVGQNLNGTYYTYEVTVNGKPVEAVDPYARTTGVNGNRGMVIDLDSTDPAGWASDKNPNPVASQTDAIIYELHVRDFSIDASSGMTNKGKYLAFTEEGTVIPGTNVSTGIDYLDELGITHLHLLPVYDYGSVDETLCNNFNWGYDPVNYNVPEGSYSTDPYNGATRVNEFKQMVKSLHDNGISVVMDVVYNHVYDSGKFCFNNIVPGYFSRPNSNTSGCGNDTASEREMVRKYIVESVLYWHQEYHIDGFRFDLVGLLDVETINQIVTEVHKCCPDVIFYGEGWDMDGTNREPGTDMAKQGNASKTPGFAYFSDSMRNNLGGNNGNSTGFVSGAGNASTIAGDWLAKPWWTTNPEQVIQYASCHDNYTLADKLIISTGAGSLNDNIIKMNNLAAAVYMTAQGVPFIHAHEEVLREKLEEDGGRSENSYNASDFVNHLDWNDLVTYADNVEYYQGLIAFRKAHPALRLSDASQISAAVQTAVLSKDVFAALIDGNGVKDDDIFVIFNAGTASTVVQLPEGVWNVCIDEEDAGTSTLYTAQTCVQVKGISAMVLTRADKGVNDDQIGGGSGSDTITVYFSNNKKWENVKAHYWGGTTGTEWPGEAMTWVGKNDYGEDIYSITVPANTTGVVFNGSGGQTVDITELVDGQGYYCTGQNAEGKFTYGTYSYGGGSGTTGGFTNDGVYEGATQYYLFGYINGEDYASEAFYEAMGKYQFVDGKLTVTFDQDSYVAVKSTGNAAWYMTDGYLGAVTTATLKDTAKYQMADANKVMIPGGTTVTFTLTVNNDDTVTLNSVYTLSGVKDTSGIQDGVTLHCWNWSFKEIEKNMETIAEMGYTAIQTSPVQTLKEATNLETNSVGGHWWVYYQPVDFVITTDSGNALGTKADLESMIETAHEYGIKVIVDVVANHLGNQTGNDLSDQIPDYLLKNEYWHDINTNITNWEDRYDMTQHCMTGLPDLNTSNKKIQGYVLDFLKECIDIGVDGFRFDMAKSIETPKDAASFASDFWPTVIGGAEAYAKENGKDVYMYGEVLNDAYISINAYTEYMAVTDNVWGNSLRNNIAAGNAALNDSYCKTALASNLVIWAESHDTFATDDMSQSSFNVSEANINKTWALVAARADAMGLYLARPEALDQAIGVASLTGWDNPEVRAANRFHNAFDGEREVLSNENGISYVERGTTGVVLVNTAGGKKDVSVTAKAMAAGTYMDQITGATFTVADGKITGTIGDTGIAVVYNATYEVEVEVSASGTAAVDKPNAKAGETVTITVKPDEGCKVVSVTVKDEEGNTLKLTENTDGTYSFEHPASDVTIEVVFEPDYKIVLGDKASAALEEVKDLTFKVNGALSKFQSLKINDKVVDAANYTLVEGSTVLTLKESYLKMMEAGTYTITFVYTDGEVSGTFTLTKDTDDDPTDETTKPSEDPDETTKPSEDPDETTKPSEDPDETTKPSEDPDETTKPSEDPDETTKPSDETTKPSDETTKPSEGTTEGTVAPTVPSDDTNVPTGDTSYVVLFTMMMLLSAAAVVALLSKRKLIR